MGAQRIVRPADYRVLAEFRYQIRRFLRFSEQAVRRLGLESAQHQLLLAIKGSPCGEKTATITDLAERLQIQHHSAVELVDRLAKRGLVERSRDKLDHRKVFIHLTAAGEAALENLSVSHLDDLRCNGPALAESLQRIAKHDGTSKRNSERR